VPKSDVHIKIPDMKIKTLFKDKTKIIRHTLPNRTVVASASIIVKVEEVKTTYLSTKKTICFGNLF